MARVEGFEPNHSGQQPADENGNAVSVGVWGDSDSGVGVFGSTGVIPAAATDIPIEIAGVEGHSFERPGVLGRSLTGTGVDGESVESIGVLGRSRTGSGMLGVTFNQVPGEASGVFGSSVANGHGVTGFVGSQTGVVGSSVRGTGVRGVSTGIGVFGENVRGRRGGAAGVLGVSAEGSGVRGASDQGVGVFGSSPESHGTWGLTFGGASGSLGGHISAEPGSGARGVSLLDVGVEGISFDGTGVRGESSNGLAGDFVGDVRVTGAVFKGGGGFEIDHPLDPENKYLAHSFVESPEMLNVYSGTVTTDASGEAEVRLPDYFETLNSDYRYQLTVIGEFAQAIVARELHDNRFTIGTDRPQIKVCWQVTGVRQDPWAQANRIAVESNKDDTDRGRYLHPELRGKTEPGIGSRANEARRRVIEMLPESLRERCEALLTSDRMDREELQRLVDEATRMPAGPERTDPAQLEDDWRSVQETVRQLSPGGDTAAP
jgi:hypothetical protein